MNKAAANHNNSNKIYYTVNNKQSPLYRNQHLCCHRKRNWI